MTWEVLNEPVCLVLILHFSQRILVLKDFKDITINRARILINYRNFEISEYVYVEMHAETVDW